MPFSEKDWLVEHLINQIIENTTSVLERRKIQLNIFAIASSSKVILNAAGVSENWEQDLEENGATEFIC